MLTISVSYSTATCFDIYISSVWGRDSSVGIATSYGLGSSVTETRWGRGRDFPHPSTTTLGPTQPLIQWVQGLFSGSKMARAWRWPTSPSGAEIKERVEIWLYSC